MKARWLVAVVCVVLLGGGVASASEVGNNPSGSGWRWDVGFERSEREVKLDDPALMFYGLMEWENSEDYYGYYEDSEWIESFDGRETLDKYFVKGAYGFGDKYVFYVTLGMARMGTEMYDPLMSYSYVDYEYNNGSEYWYWNEGTHGEPPMQGLGDWDPYYGTGFKAVFYDQGGFKVGMDLQWNQYKLDSDTYFYQDSYSYGYDDPASGAYWSGGDEHQLLETDTSEYHAALIFSKSNQRFSPYGGIKLSQYETDYSGRAYGWDEDFDSRGPKFEGTYDWTFSTKQQDYLGLFLGMDCEMTDNFLLSGEIRVGDETATTIRLSWKF